MLRRYVVLFSLLLVTLSAWALSVPAAPDNYVNDYANMFSDTTKQALNKQLADFDHATSNQIFIATFPSLEGESLEDFTMRLAEKWRAGSHTNNNGVLIVFFKNDKKIRIEVGYGLESVIPDARAGEIIQNVITPRFHEGNFDTGVKDAVNAIIASTTNTYHPASTTQQQVGVGQTIFIMIFLILVWPIFGLIAAAMLGFFGLGWLGLGIFAILFIIMQIIHYLLFNNGKTLRSGASPWIGYWGGSGG
jgi:uncharacterized protein